MKKLSLAVFNTQPPHLYFGGVERRIMETAKRLQKRVAFTVYSGTKAGFRQPVTVNGATIIPCFSTDKLYPVDNWVFNFTIANATDTIKADIYEAHAVSGYGFVKALRKRNSTKPFVQTVHGVLADEYVQSAQRVSLNFRAKISNRVMRRLAKLEEEAAKAAALIVTVSNYSAQKIMHYYGVNKAKIRVVTNGVDTNKFAPASGAKALKQKIGVGNRQSVLFVGRLIPRKGLPFLVEAAKHVVKERKDTAFVIVGNGPLKNHLVAQLEKMKLTPNFIFLGDVNEVTLAALYNCVDLFAFPSIQEGLGIVLLEAQATAKPVVAFDVGGVREALLNKESGLLVKPDSLKLADAILRLLANGSLRDQMGRKGRAFVHRNYSWDTCAQKMLKVYHDASAVNA